MSSVFQAAISNFLSPIAELLDDPTVSEVMINGPHEIFVERKGLVEKVPHRFNDESALLSAMRSIAQSVGRVIDEQNPRLDARLPDGSRLHVIIPPMARNGTTVSIRKFKKDKITLSHLVQSGSLSKEGARFLDICVYLGKNIIVSGGTGSGKTTLLNVLGGRIPETQRLLVIEDSSELQIKTKHVVKFETRKADERARIEEVSIRDLVNSAMRLRPDRIVVGEVRGPEAIDLIQVMNTGHDGSMGTVHANGPSEACLRLETLCLMGESRIPPDAIKKMIAQAIDIVVQCRRYADGGRRISSISEIIGVDSSGRYLVRDIFHWAQSGVDKKSGKFQGRMKPCQYVPTFFEEIVVNKLPFPKRNFIDSVAKDSLKKAG